MDYNKYLRDADRREREFQNKGLRSALPFLIIGGLYLAALAYFLR